MNAHEQRNGVSLPLGTHGSGFSAQPHRQRLACLGKRDRFRSALWHLAVDTFGETPHDLFAAGEEQPLNYPHTYLVSPRSSAILLAKKPQSPMGAGSK
jgi:hypothetical protein